MNDRKRYLVVFVLVMAIIVASIPIIFIIIVNTAKEDNIQIEFTPKQMKSCPNHTAWLLLDIRTKTTDLMANLSLQINTNTSIKMEYEIWETAPLSKTIEVFLYPNTTHINNIIEVEATINSKGITKKDNAIVNVINWTIDISPEIITMRDEFVKYFSNNHSNFKINESTIWEWLGNPPQIIIVEHYLFKSTFWEMELARHVMIAPYDWVTVYLRPRYNIFPNWSGIINSWSSGNYTVVETEPPDEIFR
ncbi:MAG: hypothetical protein ACFE9C_05945 [Candidatus Hodarchaeota archaeon]